MLLAGNGEYERPTAASIRARRTLMGHYKSNLRDLEFNLFEVFNRQEILGTGPYADVDQDTAREILHEVGRLAENELAESLLDSDRNPPVFDPATSSVKLPASFIKSYKTYLDAEWWRMDVPRELGGTVVPPSLRWAVAELVLGSNPGVHLYSAGFAFSKVLYGLGTEDQKKLARHMVDNKWGGTMVLTEPDAGSDVGAGAGTKGLSLFVVPKFHVDLETGALGERNGAYVTNIEHKMGLKVSTTCEITFGDKEPAVGTLVGDVHNGIAQMFRIIEFARMMVGTKAIATLSTGYLNALDYAKQRVQGADLTQMTDKAAPRVTITHHPDIRRSLMLQKAYAEGLRSLVIYTASQQDVVDQMQLTTGSDVLEKGSPAAMANRVNDLLLPIVKGVGSERAWVLLGTESLQTLGGSGFLQDYPIEQYVRDAKIDTLYEGTTAIQGLDFFFRKVIRDKGVGLGHITTQIKEFVKAGVGTDFLHTERELLGKGLDDVEGIIGFMVGELMKSDPTQEGGDPANLYKIGQNTSRLLLCAGDLVVGWLLLRQAEIAKAALDAGAASTKDQRFYEGKIAAASFFARTVLPKIAAERQIAEATDNSLMDVPEDAF